MRQYEHIGCFVSEHGPLPLKIDHLRPGSRLHVICRSLQTNTETACTHQLIPNPLFEDSTAFIQRERSHEHSMITFYTRQVDTSHHYLVGARCNDITGEVSILTVYQIVPLGLESSLMQH